MCKQLFQEFLATRRNTIKIMFLIKFQEYFEKMYTCSGAFIGQELKMKEFDKNYNWKIPSKVYSFATSLPLLSDKCQLTNITTFLQFLFLHKIQIIKVL